MLLPSLDHVAKELERSNPRQGYETDQQSMEMPNVLTGGRGGCLFVKRLSFSNNQLVLANYSI